MSMFSTDHKMNEHKTVLMTISDVTIIICTRISIAFLEYLNSGVPPVTHMYKTISTRGDTVWTIKLSLLMTTPPK